MAMKREKCAGLLKEIFYQNVKDKSTINSDFTTVLGEGSGKSFTVS